MLVSRSGICFVSGHRFEALSSIPPFRDVPERFCLLIPVVEPAFRRCSLLEKRNMPNEKKMKMDEQNRRSGIVSS